MKEEKFKFLLKDFLFLLIGILIAFWLGKSNFLDQISVWSSGLPFYNQILSFITGFFFVSVFTAVPASVLLVHLSESYPIVLIAFWAAFGSVLGDFLIFYLIRHRVKKDTSLILGANLSKRLASIFQIKAVRWLVPVVGAFIVASPFPDEIGLTLMGFSHLPARLFVVLSFFLNFLGLLLLLLAFS